MEERLVSEVAVHGYLILLLPACEGTVYPMVACDSSEVERSRKGLQSQHSLQEPAPGNPFPAVSHTSLRRALTL